MKARTFPFVVALLSLTAWPVACGSSSGGASGGGGGTSTDGGGGMDVLTGPTGSLSVWTAPAGTKVQPTTAAGPSMPISVSTYRDAYVGAQLVVRGSNGHLQGVTANVEADLSDGQGHTLPAKDIALFLEYFIDFSSVSSMITTGNDPVPANSPTHDGHIADPLIPLVDPYTGNDAGQPFDVAEGTNQALFVDVHVPKGLVAGTYTGNIKVAAASGGSSTVPISVTVWNFDLPDMRTVTTHFKLSLDYLYYYHGGTSTCSGGNCYLDTTKPETLKVVQRYEDLAHAHRIDVGQALADPPVNGCTPPADTDWAAYDAAMAPYMSGSYFTDGIPSSRFDVPFAPGQNFGIDGMCDQTQYEALATAWTTHLTSKGWFPTPTNGGFGAVVYAYDEPLAASSNASDVNMILNQMVQNSSWLQAGASGSPSPWKAHVIDTTSPIAPPANPSTTPLLDPALGVFVVGLTDYGPGWDDFYGRTQWQTNPGLFNEGIALWFYESNSTPPPYPTFATNTLDANEPVIMMWGSWFEKATGFLYWDISDWSTMDPWGPEIDYGKTGDGVLIYPGNHDGTQTGTGSPSNVAIDGPVPSYRLKMIRQGLQDWALFRYADSKGLTSFVQQQVSTVYTQLGGTMPAPAGSPYWTTDQTKMDAIRAAVVAKVAN